MLKFARIISKSETRYSKDVKATHIPGSTHETVAVNQTSAGQVPDDVAMQKTIVLTDLKRHFQVIDTRTDKTPNCPTPTFTVSIVVRDPAPVMASRLEDDDFYSSFEPIGNFELDTKEECHQFPREVLQTIEEIPSITITQPDEEAENDSNPPTETQPTVCNNNNNNSSSPPEVGPPSTSPLARNEVDVILCWTGPYIKQPHEQRILQSVQNAFLTKKKLEKEEVELVRLTNELENLQTVIQNLQHKLSSENLPFVVQHKLHRQLKENLNRSTQLKQAVENQENDIKELAVTFDALMEEGRRQLEEHNS